MSAASTGTSTTGNHLWLVKTSDRIIGPFTMDEVSTRLRSREIVIIDEVMAPQSRWKHIRDVDAFAAVVEEIRENLMTNREDTEIGSGAATAIISTRDFDEDTPVTEASATQARFDSTMNNARISDAEIVSETEDKKAPIREASVRDIGATRPETISKPSAKPGVHSTLSYAPPKTPKTSRDTTKIVSQTSKFLWGVVIVTLLGLGGAAYVFKVAPARRASEREGDVVRLRREADKAWNQAEFLRALKLYEQINREPHADLETDLRQAILMLRVERETLAAKRRLQELLPKLSTAELKIRARVALAVADLQADDAASARKALVEIVEEPEAGPVAYFNLAAAQAATNENTEAIKTLKKIETNSALEGPAKLLRAILLLREDSLKQAAQALEVSNPATFMAWRQEVYGLGAAVDWAEGIKKRSAVKLRLALDTDPLQTSEFYLDPLVFAEAIRWKQFTAPIEEFAAKSKSNGAKALYALALIKADRRTEAQSLIAESLSSKMNDTDLQAINAYGLMQQGRDDEARGALRFSKGDKSAASTSMIGAILEGRLCERANDTNCADTVWMNLKDKPNHPLIAEARTARVEARVSRENGVALIERLRTLYPESILVRQLVDEWLTK